ncbi:TPA: sce7726 family protein [Vibrio vulnificus]|nr:sce7726 family protein [Vibrio vulnificus]HAS6325331.1 sce7726 family protein [Vibrio vulnificus]HDY7537416.1 sce7726 family protein [Vibrio vulnificus]HDY7551597.1 sce7726 family protein [Vibrio vulnificus]
MKEMQIKTILVKHLLSYDAEQVLGCEVPFQFGSRRADVVSMTSEAFTAYEIKGAEDKTDRLAYQTSSYKSYFDFCYIVCEESNLSQVRNSIGREIGIILVSPNNAAIIRKSYQFKRHDKENLASTLPVPLLRKLIGISAARSKHELCVKASKLLSLDEIRKLSRQDMMGRYLLSNEILKKELGEVVTSDDILTLTRMPPDNLVISSKVDSSAHVIEHSY